jgi:hypothetical protein
VRDGRLVQKILQKRPKRRRSEDHEEDGCDAKIAASSP